MGEGRGVGGGGFSHVLLKLSFMRRKGNCHEIIGRESLW